MRTYVRAAAVAALLAAAFAAPASADAGCVTTWVESHGRSVALLPLVASSAGAEPGGPVWVNPYPAANFAGGVALNEAGYATALADCVV